MIELRKVHHVAIICKDYPVSKHFYTSILGLRVVAEHYRKERDSWKLDLAIADRYVIELFSFPDPPGRPSRPEATGLRHLAFEVDDVRHVVHLLAIHNIIAEPVRIDEFTGKRFTFISDPDLLPIEFYER